MSLDQKARAVADVTQGTILAAVEIAAPPERVFRAITSDDIVKWWGSPDTYRTTEWVGDPRPGGHWRASGVGADGQPFSVEGEFLEVSPFTKLVQTWKAAWDGGNVTKITYQLEPIAGGTRLTLRHEGFGDRADSCRGHGAGWERVLGWLTSFLKPKEAPAELRYFVCRLLAPRPTFAQDMTAAEAEMMGRHAAYWTGLMKKGTVLVFGPVGDPKGAWGLGVVRVASEAEALALRDGDPAIQSGRGFSYEILPMLRAVVPSSL
jgi:uncharacterized protein YndB with AHSA1/START domain